MRSVGDPLHIAHEQRAVRQRGRQCHGLCPVHVCTPSPLSVPPNRTTSPSLLPNTPSPFHLFSSRSTLTGLPLAHGATGTHAAKLHRVVSETFPRRVRVCIRASTLSESDSTSRETATLVRRRSYQSPMCVAVG